MWPMKHDSSPRPGDEKGKIDLSLAEALCLMTGAYGNPEPDKYVGALHPKESSAELAQAVLPAAPTSISEK